MPAASEMSAPPPTTTVPMVESRLQPVFAVCLVCWKKVSAGDPAGAWACAWSAIPDTQRVTYMPRLTHAFIVPRFMAVLLSSQAFWPPYHQVISKLESGIKCDATVKIDQISLGGGIGEWLRRRSSAPR